MRTEVEADPAHGLTVVGEAADVATAVGGIVRHGLHVVLLDAHLPGGGGIAVLESILPIRPEPRFLALSVSDTPEDVISVVRAAVRGWPVSCSTRSAGPPSPAWIRSWTS